MDILSATILECLNTTLSEIYSVQLHLCPWCSKDQPVLGLVWLPGPCFCGAVITANTVFEYLQPTIENEWVTHLAYRSCTPPIGLYKKNPNIFMAITCSNLCKIGMCTLLSLLFHYIKYCHHSNLNRGSHAHYDKWLKRSIAQTRGYSPCA